MAGDVFSAEVWGDPISHSRSPQLHRTAYRALGVQGRYQRRQVNEQTFSAELNDARSDLRGLSLTMPLKRCAYDRADTHDHYAQLSGAVNTLLITENELRGYNTDVHGMIDALRAVDCGMIMRARIVGAGATATSAMLALAALNVSAVDIVARRPEAAEPLRALGESEGVSITVSTFDAVSDLSDVPLTISTLPSNVSVDTINAQRLIAPGGFLFDVVYGGRGDHGSLLQQWRQTGPATDGLSMLVYQAVRQVRIFVTGDAERELPEEEAIIAQMFAAVMEE